MRRNEIKDRNLPYYYQSKNPKDLKKERHQKYGNEKRNKLRMKQNETCHNLLFSLLPSTVRKIVENVTKLDEDDMRE